MASAHANTPPRSGGHRSVPLIHFATALMAVVDFIVFHAVAVGLTIAIYFSIPQLDDAIGRSAASWNWLGIFKIVGPTVTVPGGAVTVLSAYFYARRIQEAEKEKQEAERREREAERRERDAERRATNAETEAQNLRGQLEQATAPHHRRNRRRLRNGPSQRER